MKTTPYKNILADRVFNLAESQTLSMAKKARELASEGKDVIKLSLGEPDFQTPQHIKDAAKRAIEAGHTFYTPVAGIADLRQAIAEKLNKENQLNWQAENIVVSTGAKQSLANVMLALLNPEDEVLIFAPYWVTYHEIVKLAEGKPVIIKGELENDFKITPKQLEEAITPRTKAILYSSPSNPTGSVYTKEELQALAEVVAKHDSLHVIADEIYEHITFIDEYYSMGAFDGIRERVITVNGFSKGFAMTGWRVGYIAANKNIAKACEKIQGQVTSATCSIAQYAALEAITSSLEPSLEMKKAYLRRRDLLLDLFKDIESIKTYTPKGAFYLFPDVSAYYGKSYGDTTIENSTDLSMYLLNEALVATVPGVAFGADKCIRISYASSDEDLKEAMRRIKLSLRKLKS